jgi:hypothetical protein
MTTGCYRVQGQPRLSLVLCNTQACMTVGSAQCNLTSCNRLMNPGACCVAVGGRIAILLYLCAGVCCCIRSPHPECLSHPVVSLITCLRVALPHLCRKYVDEADAAVADLIAGRTFRRPKIWEPPLNAWTLEGIGPQDKYGVMKEVHVSVCGWCEDAGPGGCSEGIRLVCWTVFYVVRYY